MNAEKINPRKILERCKSITHNWSNSVAAADTLATLDVPAMLNWIKTAEPLLDRLDEEFDWPEIRELLSRVEHENN